MRLHTLGSVTFGITTTFKADGASFLTLVSPPGWYWYGPAPPSCFHGSLSVAFATVRSDEALVGERAVTELVHISDNALGRRDSQKCHPARPNTPLIMPKST